MQSLRLNLSIIFFLIACIWFPRSTHAQKTVKQAVLEYIKSLQKSGGGYGWSEQPDGHITPTYAAVGTLLNLNSLPQNRADLIEWVKTHHPQTGENMEAGPSGSQMRDIIYQQMQTIAWLGGDFEPFKKDVSQWKSQRSANANFEETKFGNLWQETFTPISFALLQIPVNDVQKEFTGYFDSLRRPNGSYNNAPTSFGGDGNILNTHNVISSLKALAKVIPAKNQLVKWLQDCQDEKGGFTHQPSPELAKKPDIIYTWAAIKTLQELGAKPLDTKKATGYILSCQDYNGGFGNKPGLIATPMSTYYAVDALRSLNALNALDGKFSGDGNVRIGNGLQGNKVYTVQFQSVGNGSPKEAVSLAKEFKIDLWGAKNSPDGWIAEAQRVADESKVPVHFFITDEPYNKNVIVSGMGKFGHILDYYAKAGSPMDLPAEETWKKLTEDYFKPLLKNDGGLILQVSNSEPVARILLDESIDNGGYTALATHHFDQNFAFWLPYLFDYSNRLPMVCLQDGHGTESWWWADELQKERTLFIAKDPSYQSMADAVKKNYVVSVKHDTITNNKTRMMGGLDFTRNFISSRENDWKWWKENGEIYDQPWGIITAVFPGDKFEEATPQTGVNVRIRCWYKTRQQALLQQMTELINLSVNGKKVQPELIERKNTRGQLQDVYYVYRIPSITRGNHKVEAAFQKISGNEAKIIKTSFNVK